MNPFMEKLILELRQTKAEIETSLQNKHQQVWLTSILEAELQDINAAIQKYEDGNYGLCELSGEWIPIDVLATVPTLKSFEDTKDMESYYKKPLFSSFL